MAFMKDEMKEKDEEKLEEMKEEIDEALAGEPEADAVQAEKEPEPAVPEPEGPKITQILRRKKAVFRWNTLCISRKNSAFPAQKIG